MNAQTRIALMAQTNGWTPSVPNPSTAMDVTFRKGSRYVYVSFDVRGRVTSASWQTGSYGGRHAVGPGKAEQVLALLPQDRWSRKG